MPKTNRFIARASPPHDRELSTPLEHELLEAEPDESDHGDPGQHHVGVQEFPSAEDQPAGARSRPR